MGLVQEPQYHALASPSHLTECRQCARSRYLTDAASWWRGSQVFLQQQFRHMVQVRLQCLLLLVLFSNVQIGLMLPLAHPETGLRLLYVKHKPDDSYCHRPDQEVPPVPEVSITESRPLPLEDVSSDQDDDQGRQYDPKRYPPEEPSLCSPSPTLSCWERRKKRYETSAIALVSPSVSIRCRRRFPHHWKLLFLLLLHIMLLQGFFLLVLLLLPSWQ